MNVGACSGFQAHSGDGFVWTDESTGEAFRTAEPLGPLVPKGDLWVTQPARELLVVQRPVRPEEFAP